MPIDAPRRLARAAGDEAFRNTPFRRDTRKLLWSARYDNVTVALAFDRSLYGPTFSTIVGAHVDGIVLPYAFDARDVTTYVLYARLWLLDKTFDEELLDLGGASPPGEERAAAIVEALKAHALPLLARCSTPGGLRDVAAEQPAESGFAQRLRWFLGIGPRPGWMEWEAPGRAHGDRAE